MMILDQMLGILVADWRLREKLSSETVSLSEVVRLLGSETLQQIDDSTTTAEIVDLVQNFLAENGILREATKAAHQYDTREELLRETTLMGVVQDWKAAQIVEAPHGN